MTKRHTRFSFAAALLALALTTGPACTGSTGEDGSATTASDAGACTSELDAGTHEINVGDTTALLYVPPAGDGPHPLVVDLHGSGGTGQAEIDLDGIVPIAEAEGFAVLAPTGVIPFPATDGSEGFAWNIPGVPLVGTDRMPPTGSRDDVAYIGQAIDAALSQVCVDETRIYATGISGGGRMASQLACDMSDRIAAIVAMSGLRFSLESDTLGITVQCNPTRPVAVGAIHGVLDPVNAFADVPLPETGSAPTPVRSPAPGSSWSYSAETAAQRWATFNRCEPEAATEWVTPNIEVRTYTGCAAGTEVALYVVHDGGHLPPGHPGNLPVAFVNPTNTEADGTQLVWDFLSRFARSPD